MGLFKLGIFSFLVAVLSVSSASDAFSVTTGTRLVGSVASSSSATVSTTTSFAAKTKFAALSGNQVDPYQAISCDDKSSASCGNGYFVITSWQVRTGSSSGSARLKVYSVNRSTSGTASSVSVVTESGPALLPANTVTSVSTQIPFSYDYSSGEELYIGLYVPSSGPGVYYSTSDTNVGSSVFSSASIGSTQSVSSIISGAVPNVQAVVETDLDADGLGDVTQDSSVTTIAPSPAAGSPTDSEGSPQTTSGTSEQSLSSAPRLSVVKLMRTKLKRILSDGYFSFKLETTNGYLSASSFTVKAVQGKRSKTVGKAKSFSVQNGLAVGVKLSASGKKWLKNASKSKTKIKIKIKIPMKTATSTQTFTRTYTLKH